MGTRLGCGAIGGCREMNPPPCGEGGAQRRFGTSMSRFSGPSVESPVFPRHRTRRSENDASYCEE